MLELLGLFWPCVTKSSLHPPPSRIAALLQVQNHAFQGGQGVGFQPCSGTRHSGWTASLQYCRRNKYWLWNNFPSTPKWMDTIYTYIAISNVHLTPLIFIASAPPSVAKEHDNSSISCFQKRTVLCSHLVLGASRHDELQVGKKALARFGEFCSCCCLPVPPELAYSIHAT